MSRNPWVAGVCPGRHALCAGAHWGVMVRGRGPARFGGDRGLTILLMGFRLGGRGRARRPSLGRRCLSMAWSWAQPSFCPPCTLVQWPGRRIQGGPLVWWPPWRRRVLAGVRRGGYIVLPLGPHSILFRFAPTLWHNPDPLSGLRPPAPSRVLAYEPNPCGAVVSGPDASV